jgi:phosphoglycerate dehydrogenase-like enzyme
MIMNGDNAIALVPDSDGPQLLGTIRGVTAVPYQPGSQLPAAAARAQILIPPLAPIDPPSLLIRLPQLELVQLLSAGAEPWAGQLPESITLSDCRGAHGAGTADWVLTALLSSWRRLPDFVAAQAAGRWSPRPVDDIGGRRVLILGAGDIAGHVARRLHAFDVATTLVGRTPRDGVHGVDQLLHLLPDHDACAIVLPLTDETRGLVDAAALAAMPDGAVLINAARGPVVSTEALLAELNTGRLRAALDVTDPEPLPHGHPLWSAPGVMITPHVASNTPGARQRAYRVAAEQIIQYLSGCTPDNVVNNGY